MNKNIKIGIIGSGIQGVCTALFLQKKNFAVTLFDKNDPGTSAASSASRIASSSRSLKIRSKRFIYLSNGRNEFVN